jgi:hypothetical protein
MNTHPEFGTRVRFDLSQGTDDGARYRVTVYAPNGTFEMAAELVLATGEVRLEGSPTHTDTGLERGIVPFAKQILSTRRADPSGHWPRRVLRWRG